MKTLTAPMKKHLTMTTAELVAERERYETRVATLEARIPEALAIIESDPKATGPLRCLKSDLGMDRKNLASIDLALEERAR
jgi:uncharacterized protein involved in exopolysaccharide biosynthesis